MLAGTANRYVTHFAAIMSYYSFSPDVHGGYPDPEWEAQGYMLSKRTDPKDPATKRSFKLPYTFLEDQVQYDMTDALKVSPKPKLFILGTQDTTVDPEIVRETFQYAAEPKVLREIASDHDYRKDQVMIQQVNTFLEEFLQEY